MTQIEKEQVYAAVKETADQIILDQAEQYMNDHPNASQAELDAHMQSVALGLYKHISPLEAKKVAKAAEDKLRRAEATVAALRR